MEREQVTWSESKLRGGEQVSWSKSKSHGARASRMEREQVAWMMERE